MRNLIGLIALVEYQMCIVGAGFIVCVCMYVCLCENVVSGNMMLFGISDERGRVRACKRREGTFYAVEVFLMTFSGRES